MKRGIELIAEERQRQIDVEGYSEQHDSQHKASELIYAAIAYVESAKVGVNCAEMGNTNEHEIMMRKVEMGIHYPFGWDFKPSTDVRDLVKAGALIAGAIDRIQLAESQDEKIRKELIKYFSEGREYLSLIPYNKEQCIAWLERQGEHANFRNKIQVGDKVTRNEAGVLVNLSQLKRVAKSREKQGEPKLTGKIQVSEKLYEHIRNTCACIDDALSSETLADIKDYLETANKDAQSAFDMIEKQGEQKDSYTTIVETGDGGINALVTRELPTDGEQKSADNVGPKFHEGEWIACEELNAAKIVKINVDRYEVEFTDGNKAFPHIDYVDRNFHLWSIGDAKDGDVLTNGKMVLIFKHFEEPSYRQHIVAYIGLDRGGDIQITDDTWRLGIDKAKPATKEQRDTLMKAMADAGYTFDFERKKLEKTEPKSKENKGNIGGFSSNSKWSEEDEKTLNEIFSVAARASLRKSTLFGKSYDYIKWQNWLKSLRPQNHWKPSSEQMKALNAINVTGGISYAGQGKVLIELYNDLKKLKEE